MTGLFYKFNELGFPDELKISIKEMLSLSALSDKRTLRKIRDLLVAYRHIENDPESWMVKYEENKNSETNRNEYGTYQINYVILLELYSNNAGKLQEKSSNNAGKLQEKSSNNDNDVKLLENYCNDPTKKTKIEAVFDATRVKNVPPSSTSTIQEQTIILEDSSDNEILILAEQVDEKIEKYKNTCKLIQGKFNQFTIQSQPIKEALIKISEYPEEQQIKALEKGSLESNEKKIVSYMLYGLEQGWYDNQAQPKESNPNEAVYNHPPLVESSTPEQLEQEQKEREIQKEKNRLFLDRVKEIENSGVHFLTAREMAGKEFGFGDDKV